MNGQVTSAEPATGSQKRKRGLAPKKKLPSPKGSHTLPNGDTTEDLESKEYNLHNGSYICLVCGNCNHELVNLSQNQEMTKMLMANVGLPAESFQTTVKFVCIQCVLKIQWCQEIRNKAKDRIKRTMEANKPVPSRSEDKLKGQAENLPMLDVFYERKEPALITESGGKVNKYKLDEPHVRSAPNQFICKNCPRIYQRKHFYLKHTRRCRVRAKSSDPPNNKKDRCSTNTENTNRKLVFHCNVCPVTVESLVKLRKHKLIHLTRLYCPTCGNQFHALQDYEFHCAECCAKQVILEKKVAVPLAPPKRPHTRSQSRAASLAATHFDTSHLSMVSGKPRSEDDDDDDNQEETVSVTDTMYTNRMRYTDHWLEDYSSRTNDLFLQNVDEEYLQISSTKEYDLYLLDRLKMDIMLETFPCSVPPCEFRGESHFKLMMHEFCDHGQKLLFHCKKCGNNFTRKVHLDFHLYCQNGGRYICFKCGDVFEFQDQLDRHLIRHTKNVNYRCNYCKFEFLTKAELLEHCELENHDPNGQRKLISIIHGMTIVNPVPTSPSNSRAQCRQYREHIMQMNLPKPPKRPSHQTYFRRRLQVGDVQFKGQMHPNCSSCILYV